MANDCETMYQKVLEKHKKWLTRAYAGNIIITQTA
jgi:hypothetical protein